MFHPMAFTVVTALVGAMILSVTFIPAAVALFIGNKVEKENVLMRWAKRAYAPGAGSRDGRTVVLTFTAVDGPIRIARDAHGQRVSCPAWNEGDFLIQALRIPGTSLSQSVEMQQQTWKSGSRRVPGNRAHVRANWYGGIVRDPMPPNISDGYIMLKPESEWPEPSEPDELPAAIQGCSGDAGQQLRVLPAHPVALQRTHLGVAQRRGSQRSSATTWTVMNETAEESPRCWKRSRRSRR